MKTCVITGASGLIGSHLVRRLRPEWSITDVSLIPPDAGTPDVGVQRISLDLSTDWNPSALPSKTDMVAHFAQSELYREFPDRAEHIFRVNAHATLRLLEYARSAGARTFVLASTGSVYGNGDAPFKEDAAIGHTPGISFYAASKACAEAIARSYTGFMDIVILRFFGVYGPRQNRTMLIPRLIDSVLSGRPITLDGSDGMRINPIHASDVAEAIARLLDIGGGNTLNVAGTEILSIREMGETIGEVAGKKPVFTVRPENPPANLIGDIGKLISLCGAPKVTFRRGIATLMDDPNIGG